MNRKLTMIVLLALAGCHEDEIMTNDEIIAEVKKCREAGMGVSEIYAYKNMELSYAGVTRIECNPDRRPYP